jgi:hypothetical protein
MRMTYLSPVAAAACARRSRRGVLGLASSCLRARHEISRRAIAATFAISSYAGCHRILNGCHEEEEFWQDLRGVTGGATNERLARLVIRESVAR